MRLIKQLFSTLVFLCAATPGYAFTVTPLTIEINAEPGQSFVGSISVHGSDDEAQPVKVYVVDWDRQPDGP